MHRPKQKPGTKIRASSVNAGIDARNLLDNFSCESPLEMSVDTNSIALRFAAELFDFKIGVTTGSIASSSLASPTTGTVTLAKWTGSAWDTSGMPSITAYNIWSNNSTAIGASVTVLLIRISTIWVIIGWDC